MKMIAWLLFLCSCGASSNTGTKGETPYNNQDTLRVNLNETFEVKLGAVMASGYSWSLKDSAFEQKLKLDTTYSIVNSDREGDPETQVFRFRGIEKGETRLHFIHVRPWRKQDAPTKEKEYKVLVQ